MLLKLTNRYNVKPRNDRHGGIFSSEILGPSFGDLEIETWGPLLGVNKVMSFVGREGYMIPGKAGSINPLTGDTVIHP